MELKKEVSESSEDLENEKKNCVDEIESLKRDIEDLRNKVKIKEEKLLASKMEIEDLKQKLKQSLNPSDQNLEKDVIKENSDLRKRIDILVKENKALKIKLDKNTDNKHHDKEKNQHGNQTFL